MDTDESLEVQPVETDESVEEQSTADKDWKSEALKYKAMAYKYKLRAKEGTPPPAPKPAEVQPQENIDEKIWEVAEMIRQGYTRADAEFIQKNGGRKAMEDPNSYVNLALRTLKEQRTAEQAASQASATSGQTEIERKYTPEQLKNMSVAELEKLLPHADPY
jgi:hypothetical protein